MFKRSTKMERSPVKKEEGMEVVKEMRAGFKEIMKEVKELREGKEEMKRWMEEMRKGWDRGGGGPFWGRRSPLAGGRGASS